MIKTILKVILAIILINSCNKMELSEITPVIELRISEGYIYSNTSIGAGKQYKVGILATSANGENLTNLIVESNGKRILDQGFNCPTMSKDLLLTKSLDEIENVDFIIRNKVRKADTISIVITKLQTDYSVIKRYNSVAIGAQNNGNYGNYFSVLTGQIYTQSQAFTSQQLIDIIYYFDGVADANTLASPGANLTGIATGTDSPEFWTIKRTTRFSREPIIIADEEFNSAANDSLILAHFFTDGGRKAKLLKNGQYYGIQSNDNKYGIVRIDNVIGQVDGKVQLSLIIQQ
jgi:hypothetical protein